MVNLGAAKQIICSRGVRSNNSIASISEIFKISLDKKMTAIGFVLLVLKYNVCAYCILKSYEMTIKNNLELALEKCMRALQPNQTGRGSILSPPSSVFYDPQLQIISCYIARYYVRK